MLSKLQITGWVVGLLLASAVVFYVYTAPFNYQRLPGVRIGGQLTQHPQNWNTIDVDGVVYLKMEGFPPVVVKVFYATDDGTNSENLYASPDIAHVETAPSLGSLDRWPLSHALSPAPWLIKYLPLIRESFTISF